MKVFLRLLKLLGIAILIFLLGGIALLIKTYVVWGTGVSDKTVKPLITQNIETGETIDSVEKWELAKPAIREAFETYLFGAFPEVETQWDIERRMIDEKAYGGKAKIEEIEITPKENVFSLNVVLVTPNNVEGNLPLLITNSFCGNHGTLNRKDITRPNTAYPPFCDSDEMDQIGGLIFGDMVRVFPVEQIIEEGIAFATYYPGEIVPDMPKLGQSYLKALSTISKREVTSAISAWAWGYSLILDVLQDEPGLDMDRVAIYGHSRNGKAALWAAANDPRFDMILAHQSGTGGATLNQSHNGESIRQMTRQYPHWFDPAFAGVHGREETLPIDQHHLLALLAPRPLLLGNAMLDKWSDPKGAFLAARAASEIYDLYEEGSFNAMDLKDFRPDDRLSFWTRGAPHGVRSEDWEAFLQFLEVQFE